MELGYYTESNGFGVRGYLLKCPNCGRKIVVETILNGVSHNVSVVATCANCIDTNRQDHPQPEIMEKVRKFKEEDRPKPTQLLPDSQWEDER